MKYRLTKIQNNEQGIVAIVVTLLIMIVLTLIVTGFAQLARREQREALDRQLSTQAFYAAESGINDARNAIKTANDNGPPLADRTNCNAPLPPGLNSNLSGNSTIQYSCILWKQSVPDLNFQNVQTNKSTVAPINPTGVMSSLVVSWEKHDGPQTLYSGGGLPSATTWGNNVGVLRIDLVPISSGFDANSLRNDVFTAFLYPKVSGSGTVAYTSVPSEQGQIVDAKCDNTGKHLCTVIINNLSASNYYLRMRSIYTVSDVDVCPQNISCNSGINLIGAQAEIDSTGRANDVLKRLQVRVSTVPDYNGTIFTPEYTLESSDDICKLFSVWPNGGDASTCATTATSGGGSPGANFDDGCGSGNCSPGNGNGPGQIFTSPNDPDRWIINLTNKTSNQGLTNVSCLWDFGDGHTSTSNCQNGDYFQYTYGTQGLSNCTSYTVNLTVNFSDGSQAHADPDTFAIPLSGQYNGPCH